MTHGTVLLVIAHDGYQPIEYQEPKQFLESNGFRIVTASNKEGQAHDKEGNSTPIDLTLNHVQTQKYDGIFFIGGPGAMECLDNAQSYRIIKEALARHIPLGAICISTRILAKAGALRGKRATGWNGDNQLETIYPSYDAIYLKEPVVVEDNVITAQGPDAAKTFAQEILSLLQNNKGWG